MKVSGTSSSLSEVNKSQTAQAKLTRQKQQSVVEQLRLLDQKYPLRFIENDPMDLRNIPSRPVLSREDEKSLFQMFQEARKSKKTDLVQTITERLYEHNTLLIIQLTAARCRRHKPKNNEHYHFANVIDDFMHAIEAFDPAKNYKFSSYLRGADTNNQINVWKQENRHTRGKAKYREWLKHEGRSTETPQELAEPEQAHRLLEHVIGSKSELDQRDKAILLSRFGLNGKEALTLKEAGREFRISAERIRVLQDRALEKAAGIATRLGISEDDI